MESDELKAWFCEEVLPLEPMLVRFIRRHWRTTDDLLDIRQDVYERVLRGAMRELPVNSIGYVFTTARNVLINRARQAKIVPMSFAGDIENDSLAEDWLTPERHVDARMDLLRVHEGMERLPPRCREIIRLRKVEGLRSREIAAKLGIGIDAVHQQTMLGMRALADFMAGGEGKIRRPVKTAPQSRKPAAMSRHERIEQQAASWLIQREDGEIREALAQEFEAWMEESPAHAAAFWRLETRYRALDRLASLPPATESGRRPRLRAAVLPWFAVAACLVLIGALFVQLFTATMPKQDAPVAAYETDLGQIKTIRLADGSLVDLDTDTAVRVMFQDNQRRLWINRGRAYLQVAKDKMHPFVVDAGEGTVRVLGTRFVVTRESGQVSVGVLEGVVRLARRDGNVSALTLTRGDVGTLSRNSLTAISGDVMRLSRSIAWREGKMVLDDRPLPEVLAEFNRYNRRKLVLAQGAAPDVRISGSFRLGNIAGFARLVEDAYGVRLSITGDPDTPVPPLSAAPSP